MDAPLLAVICIHLVGTGALCYDNGHATGQTLACLSCTVTVTWSLLDNTWILKNLGSVGTSGALMPTPAYSSGRAFVRRVGRAYHREEGVLGGLSQGQR